MKLYNILFEATTDYGGPEYALFEWSSGNEMALALVHIEKYKQYVKSTKFGDISYDWICAYAGSNERHDSDCSGAVEISYIARNPNYPGAGSAMYALFSSYFNYPITSDRSSSTSNSAKQAWAKIENDSGNWTKMNLDNWKSHISGETGKRYKKWYSFQGSWPDRTVNSTDEKGEPKEVGPATPNDESDDCPVPKGGSDAMVNKMLGTADAWLYKGPLNADPLIERGNDVLAELTADKRFSKQELITNIKITANKLFTKYYKGLEG
jgi:hypothetical protein